LPSSTALKRTLLIGSAPLNNALTQLSYCAASIVDEESKARSRNQQKNRNKANENSRSRESLHRRVREQENEMNEREKIIAKSAAEGAVRHLRRFSVTFWLFIITRHTSIAMASIVV
jgi:FtsZ-interacting cell division protein YlmF